jgi:hypothetical protein
MGTRFATELFWLVPGIMSVLAQWVGVLAIRREAGGAHAVMVTGVVISTFALLVGLTGLGLIRVYAAQLGEFDRGLFGMWTVVSGLMGQLTFAAGFAVHGLRRRKAGLPARPVDSGAAVG